MSLEHDQLGGHLTYVDRGRATRERRSGLSVASVEKVQLPLVREVASDFVDARRRGRRRAPRPVDRARAEPAVVDVQEEAAAPLLAQDRRARVEDALEARVGYAPPHRAAIDRNQDRRRVADEDHGGSVAHRDTPGRQAARSGQRRLQAIERDRLHGRREPALELHPERRAVVGKRREAAARQLEVFEAHRSRDAIHLRARRAPDHADDLVVRSTRCRSDRAAERQPVALPALDLRLVDGRLRVRELQPTRPGVGIRRRGRSLFAGDGPGDLGSEIARRRTEARATREHARAQRPGDHQPSANAHAS